MSQFNYLFRSLSLGLTLMAVACTGDSKPLKNWDIEDSRPATKQLVRDDAMRCAFQDSRGRIWFGTNNEGLFRYDGHTFVNFSRENGLCSNTINDIIEDRNGNLWLGTARGLCKYDGEEFTQVDIPWSDTSSVWLDQVYPVINPNEVHCLLEDNKGKLWIGTGGAGVYAYDGEEFVQHLRDRGMVYDDSLHHNWITSITEDRNGSIWITSMSLGAVSVFKDGKWTFLDREDGLSDNMVRVGYEDRDGNMWFGSNGNREGGLDRYNGSSFENFKESDGLCSANTRTIYQDAKGNMWLGSGRGGLCLYDGKIFTEIKDSDGSSFDSILFILGDSKGQIWFGGNYGKLYRYDGEKVGDLTQADRL